MDRLLGRIDRYTLTVVTGPSGVGKTSLIRAGVIPRLRKMDVVGGYWLGPVLVLREWGKVAARTPGELLARRFVEALRQAVDEDRCGRVSGENIRRFLESHGHAAEESGTADREERVRTASSLIRSFVRESALTETGEPCTVVLIVDQGEELMGAGDWESTRRAFEQEVIDILGKICAERQRLRLLVSLREEYVGRLFQMLSQYLGEGGARRVYAVSSLERGSVLESLDRALQRTPGTVLEERARDRILRLASQEASAAGPTDATEASAGESERTETEVVNLLGLQALLVNVWDYAKSRQRGDSVVRISKDVLDNFVREAGGEEGIVSRCLVAWALKALDRVPAEGAEFASDNVLRRRIFARVLPMLTSGGVKRPEEEIALVLGGIREDLIALPGSRLDRDTDPDRALRPALMEMAAGDGGERLAALWEDLPRPECGSGAAADWQPGRIAVHLAASAFDTLRLLAEGEKTNVLKTRTTFRGWGEQGTRQWREYELVHDGFGPGLLEWGRTFTGSVDDVLGSVVAVKGANLVWARFQPTHPSLIVPWDEAAGEGGPECRSKGLRFSRLRILGGALVGTDFACNRFDGCDFKGNVFIGCRFNHCVFSDCRLDGCVFLNCRFEDTAFEYCAAQGIVFQGGKSLWRNLSFVRSDLSMADISGVRIEDRVDFRRCIVQFARLREFHNPRCLRITGSNLQRSYLAQFEDCAVSGDCVWDSGAIARAPGSLPGVGPRPEGGREQGEHAVH